MLKSYARRLGHFTDAQKRAYYEYGEKYLIPYINGLLSQTYSAVKYIFVNDGSTDKTEEIILSYKEQFEAKGWEFIYIKKENGGAASGVNAALPQVSGKYFCFVDSDDIIKPNYLEEYCNFLETHPEYKFCFAKAALVNSKNPNKIIRILERKIEPRQKDLLFEDLIFGNNMPGYAFFMAEVKAFDSVVKNRTIYESQIGQNHQVLLPLAYKYRCGYINKVLAICVLHKSNHSSLPKNINEFKRHYFNIISSIEDMPQLEKIYYINMAVNDAEKFKEKTFLVSIFKIPFLKIKYEPYEVIKVYLLGVRILKIYNKP